MSLETIKKIKENGRDRLIASSLKLFSQKGFHGCSIREICDAAKANISLISFHFGGKEGLLEVIFRELRGDKFEEMEKILTSPKTKEDLKVRLSIFLETYVDYYLEHPDVISLYLEELERGHEQAKSLLPETFGRTWKAVTHFFRDAQEQKIISESIDSKILAYQVMAPITHLMRSRRSSAISTLFSLEDDVFRKKFLNQIVETIS